MDVVAKAGEWEARLTKLQAQHARVVAAEAAHAKHIAQRLQHLVAGYNIDSGQCRPRTSATFRTQRMHRMVVQHLLLHGFTACAKELATRAGVSHLVDVPVFEELHHVAAALLRHDVEPALEWAASVASKLRRIKSTLVLQLRRFQFLELVRLGRKQEALEHANEHFGTAAAQAAAAPEESKSAARDVLRHLQQDMALLAFPDPAHCGVAAFERLFEEERWQELRQLLFREAGRALGFDSITSSFDRVLRAGLTALRLPSCAPRETRTAPLRPEFAPCAKHRVAVGGCPACDRYLGVVAQGLPTCRRTKSRLVCSMSHTFMEGDNPPMLLPNNRVYGRTALTKMAARNRGIVTCPHTGDTFPLSDLRRVFL